MTGMVWISGDIWWRRTLVVALVLSQIVYPLNYSEFLDCFQGAYLSNRIYWLNLAKNLCWLGTLVIATRALWRAGNPAAPARAGRVF